MISFYFQTELNHLPNDSVLYLGVFLFCAENMSALFPVYPEAIVGVKSAGNGSACSLRIFCPVSLTLYRRFVLICHLFKAYY